MQGILMREKLMGFLGVPPQSLASTNVTSRYYPMKGYDKALVVISCGSIAYADPATPNKVTAQIRKAKTAAGGSAADLTGFTCDIVGQLYAIKMNVLVTGVTNDVTIVINGKTYTKKAATDAEAGEFADAAGLVLCVNHATNGVAGVTAAAVSTNVSLVSTAPDSVKITAVGYESAKLVPTTLEGLAIIEVDEADLTTDYPFFAVKLTTTGTIVSGAQIVMDNARRKSVSQIVSGQYPAT